jgi:hypothetical protein
VRSTRKEREGKMGDYIDELQQQVFGSTPDCSSCAALRRQLAEAKEAVARLESWIRGNKGAWGELADLQSRYERLQDAAEMLVSGWDAPPEDPHRSDYIELGEELLRAALDEKDSPGTTPDEREDK